MQVDAASQRALNQGLDGMGTEAPVDRPIEPGDLYEDGFFHPCLCVTVEDGIAYGISLVDGSHPRGCDTVTGGIRRLTPPRAWDIRLHGPTDASDGELISPNARWWR